MSELTNKACELAKVLLSDINTYCANYTGMDGRDITTESSLGDLQQILEKGFTLHNYVIEKELNKDKPTINGALVSLEKFMQQLQITRENAEKLRLSNIVQIWNQAKIAVAVLANNVLDEYEEKAE